MSAFCRTLPVERRTSHGFAAVQFLAERRCDRNEVLRDQIQRERVYRPFHDGIKSNVELSFLLQLRKQRAAVSGLSLL